MISQPDTSRAWSCLLCDELVSMDSWGIWHGVSTGKDCTEGGSKRPDGPPYIGHYPQEVSEGDEDAPCTCGDLMFTFDEHAADCPVAPTDG